MSATLVSGRSTLLGADLRKIRERRGLSLRAMSGITGLSREALSSIERGRRYPSLHTLELLASALNLRFIIEPDETTVDCV